MRVRAIRQCDVPGTGPNPRALFPGQSYDVDDRAAEILIADGAVEPIGTPQTVVETVEEGPVKPKTRRSRK